jgi:hypothetical protein
LTRREWLGQTVSTITADALALRKRTSPGSTDDETVRVVVVVVVERLNGSGRLEERMQDGREAAGTKIP